MQTTYHLGHSLTSSSAISKDTSYKGVQRPQFLDRVRATYSVMEIRLQLWEQDDLESSNYKRHYNANIALVADHFEFKTSEMPSCVKLLRRHDISNSETIHHVIGYRTIREGEIHRDSYDNGGNYFINRRSHEVAILSSGLNRSFLALITDLQYVSEVQ